MSADRRTRGARRRARDPCGAAAEDCAGDRTGAVESSAAPLHIDVLQECRKSSYRMSIGEQLGAITQLPNYSIPSLYSSRTRSLSTCSGVAPSRRRIAAVKASATSPSPDITVSAPAARSAGTSRSVVARARICTDGFWRRAMRNASSKPGEVRAAQYEARGCVDAGGGQDVRVRGIAVDRHPRLRTATPSRCRRSSR